ncbi:MAG TPA: TolC family protein [Stellaceae bacterium]
MAWRARLVWLALCGCLVLALSAGSSRADSAKLEDVIRHALQGSLALRHAKNKIDTARGQLLEARSAFDWTALAQTGWQRFYGPQVFSGRQTGNATFIDAWRTTVGVSKQFRDGISVSPGVTTLLSPQLTSLQSLGYQEVLPTLNLTIPLLRGLGSDSTDATERAAIARLRGTRLDYDYTSQETVHDAVQLFWRCLADAQQRLVMLETDQQQTDYERWLSNMISRGQLEPSALQRAQAQHTLSNQKLDAANEGVLICRRKLSDAVGLDAPRILEPVGELPHPERYGPVIARLQDAPLIAYALDNRRDIKALKAYIEAQRDRLTGAKDELNPKVDVVLDPYQAFVRYSQSFSRSAAKGHVAEAMAAESDADIALRQGEQAVRSDIVNAVRGLKELWRAWPTLVAAEGKYQRIIDQGEQRARQGTITREELRLIEDEQASAKHALIDARLRLASILASLRLYTGSIALDGYTEANIATEFATLPRP